MSGSPKVVELREYRVVELSRGEIPESAGQLLHNRFGDKVSVEPPSFKTDQKWRFTSNGWVGYIPIDDSLGFSLQPKVELSDLFRMLEYAYNLKSFYFLEGLTNAGSLENFYERLAHVLAKRVMARARRGIYRTYLEEKDSLPYLRGSLSINDQLRRMWRVNLACEFQEHSADIEENQILTWTLDRIARSGACTERVLPAVRLAYRVMYSAARVQPFPSSACVGRLYDRLNSDYEPMHALCRFFLENSGPAHESGDRQMLPFLVDMAMLFERFVVEWLKTNCPRDARVESQEPHHFGTAKSITFRIDIVLRDAFTGDPFAIADTKYKIPAGSPDSSDVAQVVAYAEAKGCSEAFLVYPADIETPLDDRIGNIRVRSVSFSLDGDLERNGKDLLLKLLSARDGEPSNDVV